MKLKELMTRLSLGELSNLSLSNEGSGTIKDADQPKVINYTNQGLLALFTRFNLLEKNVIIELVEHITKYHLLRRFSEANGAVDVVYKYIKDLLREPFTEDAIKILEVYDSNGIRRVLNDSNNPNSLFTPQPTTLQVPFPVTGLALSVAYQAKHPTLNMSGQNLLDQDITVPVFLETALQNYVAYKVYSNMNSQEQKAIAKEHFDTYNATCIDIETSDLANQTISTSVSKLDDRGFV